MHFAALGPVLCTLFALCFPEGQSRPHHRVLEIGGRERGFDVGMRCARLPGAVHGAIVNRIVQGRAAMAATDGGFWVLAAARRAFHG